MYWRNHIMSGKMFVSPCANLNPQNKVTVPGPRPPTESLADVRQSGLLQKVLPRDQKRSVVFSDGNTAWWSECQRLGLKQEKVVHQNKEWTKDVSLSSDSHMASLSKVAGTQVVDRSWSSLKAFVPASFPRKLGHGPGATVHPEIPKLVQQWMWRTQLGPASPETFLERLKEAVRHFWGKGCADHWPELKHSSRTCIFKIDISWTVPTATWCNFCFTCSRNKVVFGPLLLTLPNQHSNVYLNPIAITHILWFPKFFSSWKHHGLLRSVDLVVMQFHNM